MKKKLLKVLLSPWLALATLALVVCIRVADPSFVESVRLRYFDTVITSKAPVENNIYTVNIDEKSLDKFGQWPFNRQIYANLIGDLYSRHAGLVVFNVLMPEKDRQGGDTVFAKEIASNPIVLSNVPSDKNKNTARAPGTAIINSQFKDSIIHYPGIIANIPELEANAAGVGITNMLPEIDGVNRRIPLLVTANDKIYPNLALETLRVASGDSTVQVKLFEGGVEKMRLPAFGPVTTDALGRVWVDWSQQSKSVSMAELPKDFGGAIVIVGASAAGIGNPVPTAKGAVWPQDLMAASIGTIANGVNIQRPDWADGAEIICVVLLSLVAIFLTRWKYGFIPFGGILAGLYFGSKYAFTSYSYLLDCVYPILSLGIVYLHVYTVKFISELNQKLQIKKQFGSYVNPTIVEKLQKNPDLIKLGGERKELSIVMTDLRGFTTLGESFGEDVEGLTQIMNDYMTALSIPVLKNDGTLIKFIGDASLHVHGAPLDDVNHAKTAVKTALEMIQAIEEFNKELTAKGRPPVGMGAGVNTGPTLIGNIGAKSKFGYDVLGDSVSTAARLEGQTKSYGVLLIIGPETARLVQDEIDVAQLDCIAVKGKTIGLHIYTPAKVDFKHDMYLQAYYRGDWKRAAKLCKELIDYPVTESNGLKHYYELMLERIEDGLPANWDGVYHATSK